jgi:hypothetical protein
VQQGPKLKGSGYYNNAYQGFSVSISTDGNTAIIGGYYDNILTGAAWIFTRNNGAWTQQGGKLSGYDFSGGNTVMGTSVSISGDGNTAIIGGPGDNGNRGAAWIFLRRDTVWSQIGSKIIGSGFTGSSQQGTAVAISSDGNTVMVGGPQDNGYLGASWAFKRSDFRLITSRQNLNKPILPTQNTPDTASIITNLFSYILSNVIVIVNNIGYVNLSDLEITLTHINSTSDYSVITDTLIYQVGGSGANFIETKLSDSASIPIANGTAPFTGTFKPSKPLSKFDNFDPAGKWILNVYDRSTGRSGTLNAWTLIMDLVTNPVLIKPISQEVPSEFKLKQNYPNPFNPVTNFEFAIPKNSLVKLIIYDITGREIETLINGQLSPGTYKAEWNAIKYSSGVYFYKLSTDNFSETKKMILMK